MLTRNVTLNALSTPCFLMDNAERLGANRAATRPENLYRVLNCVAGFVNSLFLMTQKCQQHNLGHDSAMRDKL